MSGDTLNQKRFRQPQVAEVYLGWDIPKIRWLHPCFVGLPSRVLLVSSFHSLLREEETRCGQLERNPGNGTKKSWEGIGFLCFLESEEGGEEVHRDDSNCVAFHFATNGDPCGWERSRSNPRNVFHRDEDIVRGGCTETLEVHQDTIRSCLVGQKIPSLCTELVDTDVVCNPRDENVEAEGVHRTHHRNRNHGLVHQDVRFELPEVSLGVELGIHFGPAMDAVVSQ